MKKLLNTLTFIFFTLSGLTAQGAVISSSSGCDTANLTLNTVADVSSGSNYLSTSYNASQCAYYFGNDDAHGLSSPDPNIGQLNDGLLNGEGGFDYLHFIDTPDLQALDIDGVANDPGWIHLANLDSHFNASYSSIGPAPLGDGSEIDGRNTTATSLDNLLNVAFSCTSGSSGDCNAGTWSLNILDVSGIVNIVQQVLGQYALFDQLAISIKSGSVKGKHQSIIYNIDFKDIFASENTRSVLNLQTPYNLGGTFNTLDIGGKGASHINVWARDPAQSIQVTSPGIVGLLCLSLLLLSTRRAIQGIKS
ncbi:hypothetical protein [Alteromonas sp. A079]|uniref:hypothetical protein n=1 Tax=Alteromonas sp. A079 TaxID=3410268 RepID=UPI003B9E9BEA